MIPNVTLCVLFRFASFQSTPWASVFLHWLVGMVYVFYFASFVILLREVLRPGVLWFLRNLNDPDFNPIQVQGVGVYTCMEKALGSLGAGLPAARPSESNVTIY